MNWAELNYKRKQIDQAGALLATGRATNPDEIAHALEVIGNWRAAHAFPLNTFQMGLRKRAQKVMPNVLVAQRLKRLPTMLDKLRRMPKTTLSRFQDIGGCRAVLSTTAQVSALRDAYRKSRQKHKFVRERDYIAHPRESGYRCVHLVYKYVGSGTTVYDGLQVEIQLRTRLQHAWATAVETVGTLLDQSLKSSEGSNDWLRFFSLVGSAFAFVERTPPVPNTPSNPQELRAEIERLKHKLKVREKLDTFRHALMATEQRRVRDASFFLLSLDPMGKQLKVTPYAADAFEAATTAYAAAEQLAASRPGAQVVLVGSQSLKSLRKAYPNYFLDTELFLGQVDSSMRRLENAKGWPSLTRSLATREGMPIQGQLFP